MKGVKMADLIIKSGRIIDPSQKLDSGFDLRISDGKIAEIKKSIKPKSGEEILDAEGNWIMPGLVDMHVHLREPGREDKETIASGAQAAVAGGYTAVACMPNTDPVNDNQSVTCFILEKARQTPVHVYPVGAISKGLKGEQLVEMGELVEAGAVAFSDDGRCISSSELIRRALEYSQLFNVPIIEHCEDDDLARGGCMREGIVSTRLGLQGIPSMAEDLMVARNIRIAEYTGGHLHIAHVSTRESVTLIRDARSRGVHVTSEVTPHHLFLNHEAVTSFDTSTKMNPPLGTEDDQAALLEGLLDGTIDCIATDHAPHTELEKTVEYDYAPNGVIGLETALSLVLTDLVHTRKMTPTRMVEVMSCAPAGILNIPGGSLITGSPADLTIVDPEQFWVVDATQFFSKSRNTPFHGMSLRGAVAMTLIAGKVVYKKTLD